MGTTITKPKSKAGAPGAIIRRKLQRAATPKLSGAGVVKFCVQGSSPASTTLTSMPARLVGVLQVGLPFEELEDLQTRLAVPAKNLAPMLGISKPTFHRKKGDASKLSPAVSDRVVRYARPLGQAIKVFEDPESAKHWLNAHPFGLGGAIPLEYTKTEVAARVSFRPVGPIG